MILPLGWAGSIFLAENESHINPNMCAKFGCGPTVVSKKGGGTDRQTKKTAALYSRCSVLNSTEHVCRIIANEVIVTFTTDFFT